MPSGRMWVIKPKKGLREEAGRGTAIETDIQLQA